MHLRTIHPASSQSVSLVCDARSYTLSEIPVRQTLAGRTTHQFWHVQSCILPSYSDTVQYSIHAGRGQVLDAGCLDDATIPTACLLELLYTRASIFQPQLQPCNPPIHQTNPRTITLFSKTRGESNAAIRSMINGRKQIRGLYPFARRGKTSSRVKNPILGGSREEEKKRILRMYKSQTRRRRRGDKRD